MIAVVQTVNQTSLSVNHPPAMVVHTGTTPFCPGGMFFRADEPNAQACCDDRYTDLRRLEPLIAKFDRIPWVLLHSGYDFTSQHRTDITTQAIDMARRHPHVYLEVSAMFSTREDGTFRYPEPGGIELLRRIQSRGLVNKTLFGSDANWTVGGVRKALRLLVQAMLQLEFTQAEVCRVLGGTAGEVFHLVE